MRKPSLTRFSALSLGIIMPMLFMASLGNANDRMAGSMPRAQVATQAAATISSGEKTINEAEILDVNYNGLEIQGVLPPGDIHGLGIDIWADSKRSDLVTYLSASYGELSYRPLVALLKSALLTTADTTMIHNDIRPVPGQDLTTLRIEKLLELGLYNEAAILYARNRTEPYHERYARAGVLSLLYSGQISLACIDTMAVAPRFEEISFWQQMEKICSSILFNNVPKAKRPENKDVKLESSALRKLHANNAYTLKVKNIDDLKTLSPLTMAVLHAMDRINLSALDIEDTANLPHHVIGLLLSNDTLNTEIRFRLMVESAQRGLISPDDLKAFYNEKAQSVVNNNKTGLKEYESVTGWQRIPYLYNASGNVARGAEQRVIMAEVIALEEEYGNAALWPFHDVFTSLPAESLSPQMIRAGLGVFSAIGTPIPDEWTQKWLSLQKKLPVTYDTLDITDYAYLLNMDIDFEKLLKPLAEQENEAHTPNGNYGIILSAYEKLDKRGKLHNYVQNDTYEKEEGLTPANDYVMPLEDLQGRLADSNKNKRIGETVLISSVLLAHTAPSNINGDILGQVLDSLRTVGLTKEAQSLAYQILLSFE